MQKFPSICRKGLWITYALLRCARCWQRPSSPSFWFLLHLRSAPLLSPLRPYALCLPPHLRNHSCGPSLQPCRVLISQAVDESVHCSVVVVSHTGALNNFNVDASIGPSITLPILPEFPVGVRDEETLSVTFASDAPHF